MVVLPQGPGRESPLGGAETIPSALQDASHVRLLAGAGRNRPERTYLGIPLSPRTLEAAAVAQSGVHAKVAW